MYIYIKKMMFLAKCLDFSVFVTYMVLIMISSSYAYFRPPGTCLDKLYAIPGHTMCLDVAHQHPIHAPERNDIEKKHNQIRSQVIPKAADMIQMEYLTSVEKAAQIWAEQCTFTHDLLHQRSIPGRYSIGQNMLISPSQLTWDQVIDTWASENTAFKYGQTNDISIVGNYTQIIWATTYAVGCGMSQCGSLFFYICNYAPSGNLDNIDRPYVESTSGNSCDACPAHVSNTTSTLCDCQGLVCLNGGVLNLTTCTCDCPDGGPNLYLQPYCELKCDTGNNDQTGCGTGQYTKASCQTNPDTGYHCPWLCDVCPYAGVNYTEGQYSMPWTTTVPTTTTTTTTTPTTTPTTGNGTGAQNQDGGNHGNTISSTSAHLVLFIVSSFLTKLCC